MEGQVLLMLLNVEESYFIWKLFHQASPNDTSSHQSLNFTLKYSQRPQELKIKSQQTGLLYTSRLSKWHSCLAFIITRSIPYSEALYIYQ